jgi:hypothetical protein
MMSSLITALDTASEETKHMQLGEKKHWEYTWSTTSLQEKILQLSFQLVRTDKATIDDTLKKQYVEILEELKQNDAKDIVPLVVKLLCQTRDIVAGKGEYELSYMMLLTLYDYYPQVAEYVLERFVTSNDGTQPYGSWKDIKYFAYYVKNHHTHREYHRLIEKSIQLVNKQLHTDSLVCTNDANLSLCAKWVPREGSKKHSWLFKRLAQDCFKDNYFMRKEGKTDESRLGRINMCNMLYRKMISQLNKRIDTVQIKQCGNAWDKIDHNKTTSVTVSRNKRAFLNVDKKGELRSVLIDRIRCAENFKKYIESRVKSGKEVKGKNVSFVDFTSQAYDLIRKKNDYQQIEVDLLNSQWRSNSAQTGSLNKMVAMVDTSGSMNGDPLNVAIAMGIRVAEKSILGKRVLTFSEKPTWHNLDKADGFVEMVRELSRASWQMNTNFYSALELILYSLKTQNVPPEDAEGIVLAIFSDMQIDAADKSFAGGSSMMIKRIKQMYDEAGYPCPHILFWNLRSTTGFPCLSNEKGASMMSGFSPTLLNLFCEKGMEALESVTPWNLLVESLNHIRYSDVDKFVNEVQ